MRPKGSSMSPESLEWWKNAFEITGVILLLLTFIAGAGVLWFSKKLNAFQTEKALSLRTEVLEKGARENLLVGTIRDKLIASLSPFARHSVEVRYGRSTFGVLQQVPEPAGPDVMGLANSLIKLLQEAHWSLPPVPTVSALQGPPGMTVHISPKASPGTIEAANVLVKSLRDVPFEVQGPIKLELIGTPRVGTVRVFTPDVPGSRATEKPLPPQTDETIVLVVLAHPQ
jgi:hypothetical protein